MRRPRYSRVVGRGGVGAREVLALEPVTRALTAFSNLDLDFSKLCEDAVGDTPGPIHVLNAPGPFALLEGLHPSLSKVAQLTYFDTPFELLYSLLAAYLDHTREVYALWDLRPALNGSDPLDLRLRLKLPITPVRAPKEILDTGYRELRERLNIRHYANTSDGRYIIYERRQTTDEVLEQLRPVSDTDLLQSIEDMAYEPVALRGLYDMATDSWAKRVPVRLQLKLEGARVVHKLV